MSLLFGISLGLAAGFYLVAVSVVAAVLPGVDEVPATFPASVLWHFRIASLGMQAIMWATFGLAFGVLAEQASRPARGYPIAMSGSSGGI